MHKAELAIASAAKMHRPIRGFPWRLPPTGPKSGRWGLDFRIVFILVLANYNVLDLFGRAKFILRKAAFASSFLSNSHTFHLRGVGGPCLWDKGLLRNALRV